jgi:hypothetical protein
VIGYDLQLSQAKRAFFDRHVVMTAVDKASRYVLSNFGRFVRQDARGSIRRRKGPSRPGRPPHTHTGNLKLIFFSYDRADRSVVIGPIKLDGSRSDAPRVLEHGGRTIAGRRAGPYISPRPYMGPAYDKNETKLPQLWQDSIER